MARKQVALVIGNAAYANLPLSNPVHDAEGVARRLRDLNFDVTLTTNAGRKSMGQAIDQFMDKLGTGDVAFFYYSGHGMQVDGENYLIPIDFQGKDETDVRYDAHPAGRIQERMEHSGAQLKIIVLDACRRNPYRSANRGGAGGLAAMNAGARDLHCLCHFAWRRRQRQHRRPVRSFHSIPVGSTFDAGLGLDDVFNLVRERVDEASGGKQLPWTLSSVVGRYSFSPGDAATAPTGTVTPTPLPEPDPHVRDSKANPIDGQRYMRVPPGTFLMGCSQGDGECFDDEKPAHDVTLTKGFWMGRRPSRWELTNDTRRQRGSRCRPIKTLPPDKDNVQHAGERMAMDGGRVR